MRLNPAWLSIALLCGIGCSALRDRLSQARGTPIIKVEGPTFDGKWVYGRLLVGAEDGGYVVIDRRLVEHGIIVVDDVFDCDGGSTVSYIAVDALITPPGDDDFLSIESGYWYGRDFTLAVYSDDVGKAPPPECLEALIAVNVKAAGPDGGKSRPEIRVRAYLTRPDGGAGSGTDSPDAGEPNP